MGRSFKTLLVSTMYIHIQIPVPIDPHMYSYLLQSLSAVVPAKLSRSPSPSHVGVDRSPATHSGRSDGEQRVKQKPRDVDVRSHGSARSMASSQNSGLSRSVDSLQPDKGNSE